jgi:hypothetical protein
MRSVIPFAAAAPATAAFIAALAIQPAPAAAHRICGATPVGVIVRVREKWHGEWLAKELWPKCARSIYGPGWGNLRRQESRVDCYPVGAWQRYYNNDGVVTCPPTNYGVGLVCFYRAIPCRYPYQRNSDDD